MPKLLKIPFAIDAAEGFRTDIQESTGAAPNSATYQVGFPPVTMQSIASNGMPPKGSDLNGVLYDITDNLVFLTQGGGYGFDSAYATSIGGYPLNARLRLTNGDIVKSTIDKNANDPNVDMTGWVNFEAEQQEINNLKADKAYVDSQDSSLQSQISQKAETEYVNTALSNLSTIASKFYPTLALANADIANLAVNQAVNIGESANGGLWYKATAEATSLTKSAYDPLTQAKSYTDQKTVSKVDGVLGKNLFDKSKVTNGKGLGDTGTEITAATRSISEFIPVLPSTAYSFTNTVKACFYDANKTFLQLSTGALANVISHASAAFVRIDVTDVNLNTAQVEQNIIKTAYEAFGYFLESNFISESNLKSGVVTEDKIAPFAITGKNFKGAVFLNMHNPALLRTGLSISFVDGITETVTPAYDITEYIPCLPNTQYSAATYSRIFFYRKDGSHISNSAFIANPFTTPSDCYQMRFQITAGVIAARFQLNTGSVLNSPQQPFKYQLPQLYVKPQTKAELNAITARKYNFSDAWVAWRGGQKFPICFLGDSTTNGNGTTGYVARTTPYAWGVDYVAPNSYAKLFQDLIREASGNSVMRAYNAGYSGQNSGFALTNIDAIMSGDYADTKMLGISHGINDRTSNPALYSSLFYTRIEGLINWCFDKGIQPFLMTTQPVTIPSQDGTASGSDAEEVANEIKRNLAAKYNLEIIDVNKFGQQFMQYSTKPLLNDIQEAGNSFIHFGNGGHKFTAELLFANFCKRCISTKDGEQLDYMTQLMRSDIRAPQLNQLAVLKSGFKTEVNTTQVDATNKLYQDFYVFNAGRKQLNLTAYYANAAVGQYVEVDGVQTVITQQGQVLGTLDLGLHKIKAYSSATTALDWLGFKLTP